MCGGCGKQSERMKEGPDQLRGGNPCIGQQRNICIGDYERHMHETQEEDICDKGPREPYRIPGYAGHVPTLQSRSGGTYGYNTHQVLTCKDNLNASSYGKGSHICPAPMHEPYCLPGYTGHVPGLQFMVGGSYGQDTHKLLDSPQLPLNRQENLSPCRPEQLRCVGKGADTEELMNENQSGQYSNTPFKIQTENSSQDKCVKHRDMPTSPAMPLPPIGTYKRPDEHYLKPQYKYRIGDTYATTAEITLVDPCINQESDVIVSTRELDDTQVVRTPVTLEERVEDLPYIYQPIRHQPMVPGFDTFIDAMRGARGQQFEFTPVDQSPAHTQLQQQLTLQKGKVKGQCPAEKLENRHSQLLTSNQSGCDDTPYGYGRYGNKRQRYTNSALYDFTSNYRRRQSTEWAPATISRPDPPAFDIPGKIYTQHTGLLPGYSAHVPGALFRSGKTFTDDSRDARKALRGDRF